MKYQMKYWLMAHTVHASEFSWWLQTYSWTIYLDLDSLDERSKEGDIIYIADWEKGIYAWGTLLEKNSSQSKEQGSITIGRGSTKSSLISLEQIRQIPELSGLFSFPNGRMAFLTNKQVKILDSLMPPPKPPMPRNRQFIINQPVEEDEDLYTEYKDVKSKNIFNEAYEFANAFVREEGGSIYFGISDKNKTVVGITLNNTQRDEIKRNLDNKLLSHNPPLYPNKDYFLEFHNIIDHKGNEIPELYVFELEIKRGFEKEYKTAGGKIYQKTYSGRKRIE
jgi:hypothetical protein